MTIRLTAKFEAKPYNKNKPAFIYMASPNLEKTHFNAGFYTNAFGAHSNSLYLNPGKFITLQKMIMPWKPLLTIKTPSYARPIYLEYNAISGMLHNKFSLELQEAPKEYQWGFGTVGFVADWSEDYAAWVIATTATNKEELDLIYKRFIKPMFNIY